MVTLDDVQGTFDALLVKRLLKPRLPLPLLQLINSFLTGRQVRVRLEEATTPCCGVACGTPQVSPLPPVLYMLCLFELLIQDTTLRFGYADDVSLFRASSSLDENVRLLAADIHQVVAWGADNKVFFAPEKLEMIHLTREAGDYAPQCVVSDKLSITPVTTASREGGQPALRWLGVWFDKKLSFKRHISERVVKARRVSYHIRTRLVPALRLLAIWFCTRTVTHTIRFLIYPLIFRKYQQIIDAFIPTKFPQTHHVAYLEH